MATTKSTEKILNFIREQDNPITKNQIVKECVLPSKSVNEVLELLNKFGKIEIITNGKITFVRIINESDKNANQ